MNLRFNFPGTELPARRKIFPTKADAPLTGPFKGRVVVVSQGISDSHLKRAGQAPVEFRRHQLQAPNIWFERKN